MDDEGEGPDVILRRLVHNNFGVLAYVILNKTGIPVEFYGISQAEATHYAALISGMVDSTRDFLDTSEKERVPMIEPDLRTLRLRTKKHEIIVTPDDDFTFIVIHDPNYVEEVKKDDKEEDMF